MDNETLDDLGSKPLVEGLQRIESITNHTSLFAELARLHVEDVKCVCANCATLVRSSWRFRMAERGPGSLTPVPLPLLAFRSVLFYFGSRISPDDPNINIAALGQVRALHGQTCPAYASARALTGVIV
jgi:hypothetical protein